MSEDHLTETQKMAIQSASDIRVLTAKVEDLKNSTDFAAARNAAEHQETKGDLRSIRKLLWSAVIGGFLAAGSMVVYLIQSDGGPYVSKARYEGDLGSLADSIKHLKRFHEDTP